MKVYKLVLEKQEVVIVEFEVLRETEEVFYSVPNSAKVIYSTNEDYNDDHANLLLDKKRLKDYCSTSLLQVTNNFKAVLRASIAAKKQQIAKLQSHIDAINQRL